MVFVCFFSSCASTPLYSIFCACDLSVTPPVSPQQPISFCFVLISPLLVCLSSCAPSLLTELHSLVSLV